jgi:hypothetical protein
LNRIAWRLKTWRPPRRNCSPSSHPWSSWEQATNSPSLRHSASRSARWWIEDLKWGEEFRKRPEEGGQLTFKEVTAKFLEWTGDVYLEGGFRWGKYTVKKPPDTLKSIAAKHSMTVKQLQEVNPKLRSDGSLRNGQVIHCNVFVPFKIRPERQTFP